MRNALLALLASLFVFSGTAVAQTPPPPPPGAPAPAPVRGPWSGSLSAGLSITSGNKNTQNFNISFDLTHDPKTRNLFKVDGLYLRGKSESNLTGDQLRLGGRDQFTFNSRGFVFGQMRYLRDRFKNIDYFLAPAAGVGLKLVNGPQATFDIAAGIGGVWEQDAGLALPTSGSITFDEKVMIKLTPTATLLQSTSALWKTQDLKDALYTFSTSFAAGISKRAQLKVELLDLFKNRPPSTLIKRNDVTLITGLVYKF